MSLHIIILAAGQGQRMHSDLPKVLHKVAGKPMLEHVLKCAQELSPQAIHVVVGHGGDQVKSAIGGAAINWCLQDRQLGTGHAVQQALTNLPDDSDILILYGDVPLLTPATLQALVEQLPRRDLVLLSALLTNPTGYGRVVRDAKNRVQGIVEQKDAGDDALAIREINTGILATRTNLLREWLACIGNDNAQREYYLTDCVKLAVQRRHEVKVLVCDDCDEIQGVNDKAQLARVERIYQRRMAEELMGKGVTLMDPNRIDVRGELDVCRDVEIDVNTVFVGTNHLGDRVRIGANSVVINSTIKGGTCIHENCHIENAVIGHDCEIGPFARIRPDTRLAKDVRIGNFVEIKKANVATRTKINHLSYIGDSDLGADVNIGAGTITCNYDGANKHSTVIGDNVFVGSDTQLIAPVTIGAGATIGAGSTITKDAPKEKLTLTRSKQVTMDHWQRPEKVNK